MIKPSGAMLSTMAGFLWFYYRSYKQSFDSDKWHNSVTFIYVVCDISHKKDWLNFVWLKIEIKYLRAPRESPDKAKKWLNL